MALCKHNSNPESGRDLFEGSKDAASLLACTQKKFFLVEAYRFFVSDDISWRAFRPPWPTSPGPGPKPLDGTILLKFFTGN